MTTTRATELSAICTHPDFLGRGYARRLMAHVTNELLAQGRRPFLHVSHENARAKALYEQVGFRLRRDIGFWSLRRT
jgi:predicted GNAT family acetyltransferase